MNVNYLKVDSAFVNNCLGYHVEFISSSFTNLSTFWKAVNVVKTRFSLSIPVCFTFNDGFVSVLLQLKEHLNQSASFRLSQQHLLGPFVLR